MLKVLCYYLFLYSGHLYKRFENHEIYFNSFHLGSNKKYSDLKKYIFFTNNSTINRMIIISQNGSQFESFHLPNFLSFSQYEAYFPFYMHV